MVSDSGGVASRAGYKFQDHAAAQFLIEMIAGNISEVQCETSDDIVLIYEALGIQTKEYVQVKATDGDKKWTVTELCTKKPNSSLYSGSLLLDKEPVKSIFRIITKRDVDKNLTYLKIDHAERSDMVSREKLAKSIKRASKKLISDNGNDSEYWVDNTKWQVSPSIESLAAVNQRNLLELFEHHGVTITHSRLQTYYEQLLKMADEAAVASKITAPSKKRISKLAIRNWWNDRIEETKKENLKVCKPYEVMVDHFLIKFHDLREDAIYRAMIGLEAGYELNKWRCDGLAEHLRLWLPEIALKASELAHINHANFPVFFKKAINKIKSHRAIIGEELISEILLHIGIRQCFKSEPIACKLFYLTSSGSKCFRNAHIVRDASSGVEELWLGKAVLNYIDSYDKCISKVVDLISECLDPEFLKQEREVILDLKESQHLLPNNLERILYNNAPIDDLLKCLVIPILLAYDSPTLSKGFSIDYTDKLIAEISDRYEQLKGKFPINVKELKIQVFLVPFESCEALIKKFDESLK